MGKEEILAQLVEMSRALGLPERDFVMLAEGNTSALVGEDRYLVKASGFHLHGIQPEGFVELYLEPVLDLVKRADSGVDHVGDEAEVSRQLAAARVDAGVQLRPSFEATLHAIIYALSGAAFIGHTHPTAVNAVLCARDCQQVLEGRLFPDHIVYCGKVPAFVPYIEPGLPLAKLVAHILEKHLDAYGEAPKTIFLQNHGLIVLGKSPSEVESITAMTVKSCRVLLGTAAFGGPRFLTEEDVARIHTHPGEQYRRRLAGF
ncbi:MAG: class II aldolase [Chloroflexi bacterium]|nr:MAG: class II aldolase [Chloroflexota bacterium]